jgi:UDPglucose 6-dehydrogenase
LLWNLGGKKIALWGLAFKPNTDDMRFAPSLDIVEGLKEHKVKIAAHDPVSMDNAKKVLKGLTFAKDPYAAAKGADCLILVTEWPQYEALDLEKVRKSMRTPVFLDGRNLYDPAKMRKLGFDYRSVGRP